MRGGLGIQNYEDTVDLCEHGGHGEGRSQTAGVKQRAGNEKKAAP